MSQISLRPATLDDVPLLTQIHMDAFAPSALSMASFPQNDPQATAYWADWIDAKINVADTYMLVAHIPPPSPSSDSPPASQHLLHSHNIHSSPPLAWARWVRVPATSLPTSSPPATFSPNLYPSSGDGAVAASYFQAAHLARRRLVAGKDHWFLSMIVTRPDMQRQGLGAALMRWGCQRADEEGWVAFLNASEEGRPLYELFGFEAVDKTYFEQLQSEMYHMVRQPKAKSG